MKLMKRKGRGREEARKNIIHKSLSVVIAAVIVSSVLMASMPLVAANGNGIATFFNIDPCRSNPDAELAYNVTISHTSGFNLLNMSIPAGFRAKQPVHGDLLAEAWLLDNESNEYHKTFTANGTDKIDVVCTCGGDSVNYTFNASYGEGGTMNLIVSCCGSAYANLTLPKTNVNGSLNMSLLGSPKKLTNVTISIKEFVKNPVTCGRKTFDVTANNSTSFTVCIMYPGDITGDSKVDLFDLQRLAWAFTSTPDDAADWNPCADLNCDGVINAHDLLMLAQNYLKVY